jgi:subtilisin family serine protease
MTIIEFDGNQGSGYIGRGRFTEVVRRMVFMVKRSANGVSLSRKLRTAIGAIFPKSDKLDMSHRRRVQLPVNTDADSIEMAQVLEARVMLSSTASTSGNLVNLVWQGHAVEAYAGQYVAETQHLNLFQSLAAKEGFTDVKSLGGEGYYSFDSTLPVAELAKLAVKDPLTFKALSPNGVKHLATTVPDDPEIINQWALQNTGQVEPFDYNGDGVVTPYNEVANPIPPTVINFPSPPYPNENKVSTPTEDIQTTKAWDLETGSKNVVVAVLDSGIDLTHPDLMPNIWTNPLDTTANNDNGDGFPDDINGWNFVASDNDVQDDYGHGTAVAGIIGAAGNNELGISGVDWNVSLLTVKIADDTGLVSDANEISGINYCITLKDLGINIVVMNESLGDTPTFPTTLLTSDALKQAAKAGILDVVAAGNDGTNLDDSLITPGSLSLSNSNVITVAATDSQDLLASFSNYGASSVDLAAPGVDIFTTAPLATPTDPVSVLSESIPSDQQQFTASYGYLSGTSVAAPFVTGIIALEAAANPLASPAQLKQALLQGVTYDPALAASNGQPAKVVTSGVANAYNAVLNILNDYDGMDTVRQGNWNGFYGSSGAFVVGQSTTFPSFVTVDQTGGSPVIVNNTSNDQAALQFTNDPTQRIAAYEAAANTETINLQFTDGLVHQTELYLADLDHKNRTETIYLVDNATGTVLDTRTITKFSKGQYLIYNLRGSVSLELFNNAGPSVVYSGLFFDTPPTSPTTYTGTDTTTKGANWRTSYGSQGAVVIGNTGQLPSYVSYFSATNATGTILQPTTQNGNALQKITDTSSNIAAYLSSPTSLDLNLATNDGLTHVVTLYLADYNNQQRQERIQVIDSVTGNILAQQDISKFAKGKFVSFRITGAVTFRIINTAGPSAVVSGIFFDAPFGEKVSYLGTDSTTRGNWRTSQYGLSTAYIVGDNFPILDDPANDIVSVTGASIADINGNSTNPTALESTTFSTANLRVEAYVYSPTTMVIAYNPGDFLIHTVALYFADYQNFHRKETITLTNPNTLAVETRQVVSNFSKGKYLLFDISGQVLITISNGGYPNAVISGIFTN